MSNFKEKSKRIATDAAGYGLILLGVAFGWLPGPGGIPLIIAGLGLLSINNEWAARLRDYILQHGGELITKLFPANPIVQAGYDIAVAATLVLVTFLAIRHAVIWQISLSAALFFLAVFVALMNRNRYGRLKHKLKK